MLGDGRVLTGGRQFEEVDVLCFHLLLPVDFDLGREGDRRGIEVLGSFWTLMPMCQLLESVLELACWAIRPVFLSQRVPFFLLRRKLVVHLLVLLHHLLGFLRLQVVELVDHAHLLKLCCHLFYHFFLLFQLLLKCLYQERVLVYFLPRFFFYLSLILCCLLLFLSCFLCFSKIIKQFVVVLGQFKNFLFHFVNFCF